MVYRNRCTERIASALHPLQRAFACDPVKRIAAKCGRRSGKSHGVAGRYLLTAVSNPNEVSVFIAISAARANEILGRAFRQLDRTIDLDSLGMRPRAVTKVGQLYYQFPNGHRIWVAGCKNRADSEKFRGDPLCGAGVDESDSLRGHLEYLATECLEPALMDFDGWIALVGTPGVTPVGYFHDITTGLGKPKKWKTYEWTVLDNPFVRDPEGWLRRRREELGLDEDAPSYQREWLGRWVLDLESLCYPYDPARNRVWGPLEDVVSGEWKFVLGVDLGVVDSSAFVVCAYRQWDPVIHVIESTAMAGLAPSVAAVRVMQYKQRYPGIRIVADTGGQGKAYVQEWSVRYGIGVTPAIKVDRRGQIALVGGLLRTNSIILHEPDAGSLAAQWQMLPWNVKRDGHDESYEDHESDAARYAILSIRPNYKSEELPPAHGSEEWLRKEQERAKEEAFRRAAQRGRRRG